MSRTMRFADYLEVVGFENSPFAWHLSGMPFEDHMVVVKALKGS